MKKRDTSSLWFWILCVLIVASALAVRLVTVQAVHSTGAFELDGDSNASLSDDFDTIFAEPGESVARAFIDDSEKPDASFFGKGDKDGDPASKWGCVVQNNILTKNDILHAYAAAYNINGDLHVFFGADRHGNSGNANFGFWFFQNPLMCDPRPLSEGGTGGAFTGHKTHGDLFIVSEFTRGGTISTVKVYVWTDPTPLVPESGDECLGDGIDCSPAYKEVPLATGVDCQNNPDAINPDVCATVNKAIFDAAWRTALPERTYYEGGVNLSALIPNLGCFTSFLAETRSSQELTADLKDFAFGDLNTCGSITIVKETVPKGPQDFSYTGSGPGGFDFGGGFVLDDDADAALPDTKTFENLLPGRYTVTEAPVPGFPLTGLTCTDPSGGTTTNLATRTASIDLAFGETVTCTFASVDNPPVASSQSVTTNEDTAVGFNLTASDPDGDPLTFTIVFNPSNGTLTGTGASRTYTPNANFNGPDSFTFRVSDPRELQSNVATVSITVTAVNDPPSFTKGADQTALEDAGAQTVVGWATNISAGPPDEAGQTLTFLVSNNNPALFSVQPVVAPNGTLTYTPALNANGMATVTVQLKDTGGTLNGGVDTSAPQTFTITVTPVNDPPSFTKGADQTVLEEAGLQTVVGWATNISAGPPDEAGQTLTFLVSNNNPALFSMQPAVAPNGTLTYTPALNANGMATVTVQLKDSSGTLNGGVDTSAPQTFTITVTPVNDPPMVAKPIPDVTVNEDAPPTVLDLSATFTDVDIATNADALTLAVVPNTNPSLVTASLSGTTLTLSYLSNQNGEAMITLRATDKAGASIETSFKVVVSAVNDMPVVANAIADVTVNEDAPPSVLDLSATFTDVDIATNGDALTLTVVSNTNPSLVIASLSGTTLTLSYLPNQNGEAMITIRANDKASTFAESTFKVTVTPVNDQPVADSKTVTTSEDTPVAIMLSGSDVETAPAGFTWNMGMPVHGTLAGTPPNLTYTPAPNYNGPDSFSYTVTDTGDGTAPALTSAAATVSITVVAVNDAPVAGDDSQTTAEDTTLNVAAPGVLANDTDVDGNLLTAILVSTTTNGTLFLNSNGSFTYTPNANFNGIDSFTYKANDGQADSNVATVTITVASVNDPPFFDPIADQYQNTDPFVAQTVEVGITGVSPGPADEVAGQTAALTATVTSSNPVGLVTIVNNPLPGTDSTRTLTYQIPANTTGTATIRVTADDGQSANNTFSRDITVTVQSPGTPPPALAAITGLTLGSAYVKYAVTFNPVDLNGDGAINSLDCYSVFPPQPQDNPYNLFPSHAQVTPEAPPASVTGDFETTGFGTTQVCTTPKSFDGVIDLSFWGITEVGGETIDFTYVNFVKDPELVKVVAGNPNCGGNTSCLNILIGNYPAGSITFTFGGTVAEINTVLLHTVELQSGFSTKKPLANVVARVFDRNDPAFLAVAGSSNPSGSLYGKIFEAGEVGGAGVVVSCTTPSSGICLTTEAQAGDYLVVIKFVDSVNEKIVYEGQTLVAADFADTSVPPDGIGDTAQAKFEIIKKNRTGVFQEYEGGSKTVVCDISNPGCVP